MENGADAFASGYGRKIRVMLMPDVLYIAVLVEFVPDLCVSCFRGGIWYGDESWSGFNWANCEFKFGLSWQDDVFGDELVN